MKFKDLLQLESLLINAKKKDKCKKKHCKDLMKEVEDELKDNGKYIQNYFAKSKAHNLLTCRHGFRRTFRASYERIPERPKTESSGPPHPREKAPRTPSVRPPFRPLELQRVYTHLPVAGFLY